MIRFLYTGAPSYLSDQTDPENSIGGYCSKSLIPNRPNNLFSDISYLSIFNETEECKAIVIENNTGENIASLNLGYKYDKNLYDIQIAIVELTQDGKMERIGNSKELPYYATFIDASIDELEDNSISIDDFNTDKKYGIWIKRKVKQQNTKSCQDILDSTNLISQQFEFVIKYNK